MSPRRSGEGHVRMPDAEFEGSWLAPPRKGPSARSRMSASMAVRRRWTYAICARFLTAFASCAHTAVQTSVYLVTTGIIMALLAGIALKLKVFGPGG
jgi:hypothetical protein